VAQEVAFEGDRGEEGFVALLTGPTPEIQAEVEKKKSDALEGRVLTFHILQTSE
jgi:hypothetical protein